jgi:hypothetical protein
MSLRGRIVALGVGAAAAALVPMVPAAVLTTERSARSEAQQDATAIAQGVADRLREHRLDECDELAAYVERTNGRRNKTPVTADVTETVVERVGGIGVAALVVLAAVVAVALWWPAA